MFFGMCKIRKNYQRKSSTLKHAIVNKNVSKVKMESRIFGLFKVSFNCIQWFHLYYMTLHGKFLHQEKKSYINIPKIGIYLFKHFYFFCCISTQFTDFASLKIQMQISFAKSYNVLNKETKSML